MIRILASGLAAVLATSLPQGFPSADAAQKGAGVKYRMFQPDGTPVRSKGQKRGGQNAMTLGDSSGKTKNKWPNLTFKRGVGTTGGKGVKSK